MKNYIFIASAILAGLVASNAFADPTFRLSWDPVSGAVGDYNVQYKVNSGGTYVSDDVVGSAQNDVEVLDAWSEGLTKTAPTGSERLLVLAVAKEGSTDTITGATYGGQALTEACSDDYNDDSYWIGFLNESGISSATDNAFVVAGSGPVKVAQSVVLDNVNQASPIADLKSAANKGTPLQSITNSESLNIGDRDYSFQTALSKLSGGSSSVTSGYTVADEYSGEVTLTTADRAAGTAATPTNTNTFSSNTSISFLCAVDIQPDAGAAPSTQYDFTPSPAVADGDTVFAKVRACYEEGTSCPEGTFSSEVSLVYNAPVTPLPAPSGVTLQLLSD
jgi:hypothetical protein